MGDTDVKKILPVDFVEKWVKKLDYGSDLRVMLSRYLLHVNTKLEFSEIPEKNYNDLSLESIISNAFGFEVVKSKKSSNIKLRSNLSKNSSDFIEFSKFNDELMVSASGSLQKKYNVSEGKDSK